MWWKIIIVLLALFMVDFHWEEKIQKKRDAKRLYRFFKGLTYWGTAAASLLLVEFLGDIIYVYIFGGLLFGIGSILSAINTNLREIYGTTILLGVIIWIISFYFNRHKVIFTIIDLLIIYGWVCSTKEFITNMRNGIDPDIVAEEKETKIPWFKLARIFIGAWFH